jgi:excisionase family DNA binding protein
MENIVFTQLSIPEFRKVIRQELAAYDEQKAATQKPIQTANRLEKPYLKKKEAAETLSVSQSTIDNYAREGILTRHYVGKSVRFEREQVLTLARTHQSTSSKVRQNLMAVANG